MLLEKDIPTEEGLHPRSYHQKSESGPRVCPQVPGELILSLLRLETVKPVSVGKIELIVTDPVAVRPFFVYETVAVKVPTSFVRKVTDEELATVIVEHDTVGVHVHA